MNDFIKQPLAFSALGSRSEANLIPNGLEEGSNGDKEPHTPVSSHDPLGALIPQKKP